MHQSTASDKELSNISIRLMRQSSLTTASSVGKWPRALAALRSW
jgi:hypothetical protein